MLIRFFKENDLIGCGGDPQPITLQVWIGMDMGVRVGVHIGLHVGVCIGGYIVVRIGLCM